MPSMPPSCSPSFLPEFLFFPFHIELPSPVDNISFTTQFPILRPQNPVLDPIEYQHQRNGRSRCAAASAASNRC